MADNSENIDKLSLRLYETLVSGSGLKVIVDEAKDIIGNPLVVVGKGYRVLCSSGLADIGGDSIWAGIEQNGYLPPAYISLIMNKPGSSEIYHSINALEEPALIDDDSSGHRLLIFRVGPQSMGLGFAVLLEAYKPITDTDRKLFVTLCKIASTELRGDTSSEDANKRTYEYIISEILNGKLYGDQLRQQLVAVNIDPKRARCLFVAEKDGPGQIQSEYLRDSLESMLHKCKCSVYNNKLALLFDLSGNSLLSQEERVKLKEFLITNGLICGGSSKFLSMNSLPWAYNQAITASRIGSQMKGRGPIYYLWEYAVYHMCDMLRNEYNLYDFCNPMLLSIRRYDKDNNTFFLQTLKAYFLSGRNPLKTSQLLGIHRNSVDYRLKRMSEIFFLDFNDSNIMFSFEHTMQILDYMEKNE